MTVNAPVLAKNVKGELCEDCLSDCESLCCVTFDESSSLKLIGNRVFHGSGLREIDIADAVEASLASAFLGTRVFPVSHLVNGNSAEMSMSAGCWMVSGIWRPSTENN